jgi:hypothetical protein
VKIVLAERDKHTVAGGYKSPKKKTVTKVLNAPKFVACFVCWLIADVLILVSAESRYFYFKGKKEFPFC